MPAINARVNYRNLSLMNKNNSEIGGKKAVKGGHRKKEVVAEKDGIFHQHGRSLKMESAWFPSSLFNVGKKGAFPSNS